MLHFLDGSLFIVLLYCRQWVVSENQFVLTGIVAGNPSGCEKRSLPDVYNFVGNQDVSILILSMQIRCFCDWSMEPSSLSISPSQVSPSQVSPSPINPIQS